MRRRSRTLATMVWILLALAGCLPAPTSPPTTPLSSPTATIAPLETSPAGPTAPPLSTSTPPRPLGLTRLWQAATQDTIWAIGLADVEGDGQQEIWAASYDQYFYLFDASGEQRWSFPARAPVYAATSGDLDGDGRPEFVLGCDNHNVYALDAAGLLLWSYPATGRVTHLAMGDVDGDRQVDVIAASWDGTLHILSLEGEGEYELALGTVPSALAVHDLDGDSVAEILVGTESGRLLALVATGQVLWQHGLEGPIRSLIVDDLNQDGSLDIVVGDQGGLIALIGADGAPHWAQHIGGTIVTLAGFPQDELVLVGQSGGVAALDVNSGDLAWEQGTAHGVWTFAILGSGAEPVLAAGTDGGEIVLFNRQGQLRGGYHLPSRVHTLLGNDLDGDTRPELLARSGDYLYAFHPASQGEEGESPPAVITMPFWPSPSPLPPVPEGRVSLAVVGDMMLGHSIEERMRAYGVSYPFAVMGPLLRQADIALGNLECVLSVGGEAPDKSYYYRAHPDMAAGLAWAGFDLLSLANDRALDFGPSGLTETLSTLEAAGIQPIGAGPEAAEPVIVEIQGVRVAFLARDAVPPAQEGVAWLEDEDTLREDVRRAKTGANVLVLLLHAGQLYATEPTAEQRQLAQAAVEAGADLIIGYQSHLLQQTEHTEGSFIAYGLGDFVYDIDFLDEARDGAALWVVLSEEGVVRVDWIPTRIVDDVQPRPVAAPGGRIATQPLLVTVSEPLPPPPSPRPTYVLSATVEPLQGHVSVHQQVGFPNTTGDSLEDITFFVFPNVYSGTFALQGLAITQGGKTSAPSYILSATTLRVFLPNPLLPAEALTVTLVYSLSPPLLDPMAWLPEGNIGRNEDGRTVQLGHWYPQLVPYRRGYGWLTWDYHPVGDPFFSNLADYRVTVVAPADYLVVGGGARRQEASADGLSNRWHFRLAAARDFGILVGRSYVEKTVEVGGVTLVSAYRREHAQAGQAALDMLAQALPLFQDLYGPYPYSSFVIFEGDTYGGMEFGGATLVGSAIYKTYDGTPESVLVGVVVHELAHQWWYNVVGNDQVHEPWLDEALARYSELIYYEMTYPDMVTWWWETRIDRWDPSGPVDGTIYDYANTADYLHDLYGRAVHFIQDLRWRLGDPLFFNFLQHYYRANAWQRVTRHDFFRLLSEQTGVSVDDLLQIYFQQ